MRLTVLGATRRAVAHAAVYASLGHEVLLVTPHAPVASALRSGTAPFHEPGLATLIAEHATSGRIRVAATVAEADDADAWVLCADIEADGGTDLGPLSATITSLIPRLTNSSLVVGTGLAPAGTAQWLSDWLAETSGAALVWLPDTSRAGHMVTAPLAQRRFVYGMPLGPARPDLVARMDELLSGLLERSGAHRDLVPYAAAELAPLAAAAGRALSATFANYLSELADAAGIDVGLLLAASGCSAPPRLGFGATDARAVNLLLASTDRLGLEHRADLVRACATLNRERPWAAATLASAIGGEREMRTVAILGVAAAAESDDVNASPALALAEILAGAGKTVTLSDPVVAPAALGSGAPRLVRDPYLAAERADVVVVACPWDEYRALDPVRLAGGVRRRAVLDAAGILPAAEWRTAGWTYRSFGR